MSDQTTTYAWVESEHLGEKYCRILHKSGLQIYVLPKKFTTTYAVFGTRFGAIDNCFRIAGETKWTKVPDGVAHFLEHKMFEAEDGSDTNERFACLGASANAFTSSDMTAYEFSCTENVYESLHVLLEYVTHPYFTADNVEKEQGIIGQEIGMCDDNPVRRLYYELLSLLYRRNHIRINVCGTVSSISEITPQILYRCYQVFYQLSNMALVICGDVDVEQVITVADAELAVQTPNEIDRYFEAEPAELAKKRVTVPMLVGVPLFAIGIKDNRPPLSGDARAKRNLALRVAGSMLFGTSGDFYSALYDEGLLNGNFSFGYETSRTAAFYIISGESKDPEAVYRRVWETVKAWRECPMTREDFERIRRSEYASLIRTFDAADDVAIELLSDLFDGVEMFSMGDLLMSLTYEEVMKECEAVFLEEYAAMAVIAPRDDVTAAEVS